MERRSDAASSCFNPRLPGGRRRMPATSCRSHCSFQSTPSGGKATRDLRRAFLRLRRFNPRLPGGRRPATKRELTQCRTFQSTPSGGKATCLAAGRMRIAYQFQSTPSGGKATRDCADCGDAAGVSIHAFRGEGDYRVSDDQRQRRLFQSTPSGGKATLYGAMLDAAFWIVSIHAFRGEGDRADVQVDAAGVGFNPRLPGGRRLQSSFSHNAHFHSFNPRLPGGRRRRLGERPYLIPGVSIHAFRGEGDFAAGVRRVQFIPVSIHAFRGEGD